MATFLKKHANKVNIIGIGLVMLRVLTDPDMTDGRKMLLCFCAATFAFFLFTNNKSK